MAHLRILVLCFAIEILRFSGVYGDFHNTQIAVRNAATVQKLLYDALSRNNSLGVALYSTKGYNDLDLSQPCKNHSVLYWNSLLSETWAMNMFDSITKFPEGLLMGSMQHFGNYEQCVSVRDVITDSGVFHGQHCMASLHFGPKQRTDLGASLILLLPIMIAKCIPSTCNANDAQLLANQDLEMINSVLNPLSLQLSARVDGTSCHTVDIPELETEDWITVGILIFFGILVVLSTVYDLVTQKRDSRSNLATAFSVYSNGKKLLSTSKGEDVLHCLHGIRCITMAWVVLGHRYGATTFAPSMNLFPWFENFAPDWKRLGITNSNLSVDTFFMLSGLVSAYVFFKTVPKTKSFNIPMFYVHRYIRLTPALAAMILLQSTIWKYTGSGPLWDYESGKQKCIDSWWTSLIYVSNYVWDTVPSACIGQAWYLAVDMQLYWLAPLVFLPLWKWPKIGWTLMGGLMVGGLITNFVISYENKVPAASFNLKGMAVDVTDNNNQNNMYVTVWTRFMPYVIGIALGYILVDMKNQRRKLQFSKFISLLLWLLAGSIMLLPLCIIHIFNQPDYRYEPIGASLYNAFGRPVWSLGVAMVVFLCATGHGGFPNAFLSNGMFQILSRLCYSVYLVHLSLQLSQTGSMRYSVVISDWLIFSQFFADIAYSLILATAMCLVFESPFIVLEKELLGGKKKSSAKNTPVVDYLREGKVDQRSASLTADSPVDQDPRKFEPSAVDLPVDPDISKTEPLSANPSEYQEDQKDQTVAERE